METEHTVTTQVEYYMDNTYRVVLIHDNDPTPGNTWRETMYTGSLADCEAFIRLTQEGYLSR